MGVRDPTHEPVRTKEADSPTDACHQTGTIGMSRKCRAVMEDLSEIAVAEPGYHELDRKSVV